jgi:ABC-type lipopolysaccharide export system ATPase subunit
MKKNLTLLFALLLICCKTNKNTVQNKNYSSGKFIVSKIDSINNYYIIHLKKEDSIFRIISKNENIKKCYEIKNNNEYALKLNSIYKDRLAVMKKYNINKFIKWGIDDSLKINSDSIKYYYTSQNIKGRCYISMKK